MKFPKHALFLGSLLGLFCCSGACLQAQVSLTGVPPDGLEGEGSCLLSPRHEDGKPRAWRWTVSGGAGGRLQPAAGGAMLFQAPMVVEAETFVVRVEDAADPAHFAVAPIRVEPTFLFKKLLPAVFGRQDWFREELKPLFGTGSEPSEVLWGIKRARYVPVACLEGQGPGYLVMADNRLLFLDAKGDLRWTLKANDLLPLIQARVEDEVYYPVFTALAVPPPESLASSPRRVLFACQVKADPVGESRPYLFELPPDGKPRLLGGPGLRRSPDAQGLLDPAPFAKLAMIQHLAMDRAGTVHLAASMRNSWTGQLLRISPDGQVEVRTPADAAAPARPFKIGRYAALTLDVEAGDLYALEGHRVLRFSAPTEAQPQGLASVVLGGVPGEAYVAGRQSVLPGEPVFHSPGGLLYHAGRLFISDFGHHCVFVFETGSRRLDTLVGHPSMPFLAFGQIGLTAIPGTVPEACAALGCPGELCAGPGGALVIVVLPNALATIPEGLLLHHPENSAARIESKSAPTR